MEKKTRTSGKKKASSKVESESGRGAGKKGAQEDRAAESEVALAQHLLQSRQPLTDVQRSAFRSRFADAQCDDYGDRTKSKGVFKEGAAWAAQIKQTLAQPHEGLRYSEARFTWLLECLLELAIARDAQKTAQGSVGAVRRLEEQARAAALETREDLLEMLGELAGGVEADVEALRTARGTTKDNAALATSVRALAGLADGWLKRKGETDRALVAATGLTEAHAQAARRAAGVLDRASRDKAAEGRVEPRDTPPVNRAEGRLLREMGVAMRSFAEGNRKNKVVRKLVPGPATRNALVRIRAAAEDEPKAGGDTPAETEPK
jgi:hypothetical protein